MAGSPPPPRIPLPRGWRQGIFGLMELWGLEAQELVTGLVGDGPGRFAAPLPLAPSYVEGREH